MSKNKEALGIAISVASVIKGSFYQYPIPIDLIESSKLPNVLRQPNAFW